jgi:hypothetical protein
LDLLAVVGCTLQTITCHWMPVNDQRAERALLYLTGCRIGPEHDSSPRGRDTQAELQAGQSTANGRRHCSTQSRFGCFQGAVATAARGMCIPLRSIASRGLLLLAQSVLLEFLCNRPQPLHVKQPQECVWDFRGYSSIGYYDHHIWSSLRVLSLLNVHILQIGSIMLCQ